MVSALLHEIQRDAKHLSCAKAAKGGKEGASKGSAAAATSGAADAALREAMEARSLDGLMDAIHANADGASPALLDEAQGCVELVCAGQDWGDVLLPHALVKQRKLGINVPIHAIEVACQEQ